MTLTITMSDSSTVTVTIPAALTDASLSSGLSGYSGISGLDPVDVTLEQIFRRGYFYNSTRSVAYPIYQIKSITWQ
jgi:hypothetical protein